MGAPFAEVAWEFLDDPALSRQPLTDAEVDALGVDLLWEGNDVPLTAGGDYRTVAGLENYRQAILRRLTVEPGEYRLRPTYGAGVARFVKKPATAANRAALVQAVREQVAQDRRTEKMIGVDVERQTIDGRAVTLVHVAVQALGRAVRFRPFPFQEGT